MEKVPQWVFLERLVEEGTTAADRLEALRYECAHEFQAGKSPTRRGCCILCGLEGKKEPLSVSIIIKRQQAGLITAAQSHEMMKELLRPGVR